MDDETPDPQDPRDGPDAAAEPAHLRRGGRPRPELVGPGAEDLRGSRAELELDVEGLVEAGVEHGSVVLTGADGRTWQLGPPHAHLVGCVVAVRGRPLDLMTTAQQGVPLEVLALEVRAGALPEKAEGSAPPGGHETFGLRRPGRPGR